MKKILITGINGTVGTILKNNLNTIYQITGFDLPDNDVTNLEDMTRKIKNFDVVIHLAIDPETYFTKETQSLKDLAMMFNIYKAAKDNNIKRVVMFSSIHIDEYLNWVGPGLKNVSTPPIPDSTYGAGKVYMEGLGRYFAHHGLEVICIRLGGVRSNNKPVEGESGSERIFLSHDDLISLIKCSVETERITNNFEVLYAVSNNQGRVHDSSNNIGWKPA